MLELESLIFFSFCVSLNTAILNNSESTYLIIPNERTRDVGRSGWGWGSDHGLTTFLDKIVSLLTFLSFGVFLLNLLLNALLFGSTLLGLLGWNFGITGTTGTGTGTETTTTTEAPAPAPAPEPAPAPAPILAPVLTLSGSGSGTGGVGVTSGGLTISGSGDGSGGLIVGRQGRRGKRSTLELHLKPPHLANLMAKELMEMIQAVVSANEECLPRILCVSNRRASVAGSGFQYLFPICSMGISYFGEKFGLQRNNFSSNIDAIYDGIEEHNCRTRHSDCNL